MLPTLRARRAAPGDGAFQRTSRAGAHRRTYGGYGRATVPLDVSIRANGIVQARLYAPVRG